MDARVRHRMSRSRQNQLQRTWNRARRRVKLGNFVDKRTLSGTAPKPTFARELRRAAKAVIRRARRARVEARATQTPLDLSDDRLCRLAQLTDHLALENYGNGLLDTCPRLVNVVSVRPRPRTHHTLRVHVHAPTPHAVGRGHPASGIGRNAAAQSAPNRGAVLECLLQPQTV